MSFLDFFLFKIKDKYIWLQIKLSNYAFITQIINERKSERTHSKFTDKYGGRQPYIISIKEGDKKRIHNTEVIDEIKREIERLKGL